MIAVMIILEIEWIVALINHAPLQAELVFKIKQIRVAYQRLAVCQAPITPSVTVEAAFNSYASTSKMFC
jgi:N-acetylmuramoyl-L-alanine amidase